MLPGVGLLLGLAGLFGGLIMPSEADIKRAEYYKDYVKPDPRVQELYWKLVCAGYDVDAYEDAMNEWETDAWVNETKPKWLQTWDGKRPKSKPVPQDFYIMLITPPRTSYENAKLLILSRMCERRGIPFDGKNVF